LKQAKTPTLCQIPEDNPDSLRCHTTSTFDTTPLSRVILQKSIVSSAIVKLSAIIKPVDSLRPSSPARTLGSWVRIPLKAWMFVCVYSVFL
jgi:hypothetical protein